MHDTHPCKKKTKRSLPAPTPKALNDVFFACEATEGIQCKIEPKTHHAHIKRINALAFTLAKKKDRTRSTHARNVKWQTRKTITHSKCIMNAWQVMSRNENNVERLELTPEFIPNRGKPDPEPLPIMQPSSSLTPLHRWPWPSAAYRSCRRAPARRSCRR